MILITQEHSCTKTNINNVCKLLYKKYNDLDRFYEKYGDINLGKTNVVKKNLQTLKNLEHLIPNNTITSFEKSINFLK